MGQFEMRTMPKPAMEESGESPPSVVGLRRWMNERIANRMVSFEALNQRATGDLAAMERFTTEQDADA